MHGVKAADYLDTSKTCRNNAACACMCRIVHDSLGSTILPIGIPVMYMFIDVDAETPFKSALSQKKIIVTGVVVHNVPPKICPPGRFALVYNVPPDILH